MNKTDIIITGLPRNKERFFKQVEELDNLRLDAIDQIIFSTWEGYVDNEWRQFLRKYDVLILEKEEPSDPGSGGHIWHQMQSLKNGLEICNPNGLVLKLRTDVIIEHWFLQELLKTDIGDKTWIPYAEITKPFYMPDECFWGKYHKIQQLWNFDPYYECMQSKDGGGENHVRRHIHPFIKEYPIFLDMIKEISEDNFTKLFSEERWSLLEKNLKREKYLKYLAIYYYILYKYFRIYNVKGAMMWYQPYCNPELNLLNDKCIENFSRNRSFQDNRIFCYDDIWIHNLVEGRINDSLANKLRELIREII